LSFLFRKLLSAVKGLRHRELLLLESVAKGSSEACGRHRSLLCLVLFAESDGGATIEGVHHQLFLVAFIGTLSQRSCWYLWSATMNPLYLESLICLSDSLVA
jgi:hypothetical protein